MAMSQKQIDELLKEKQSNPVEQTPMGAATTTAPKKKNTAVTLYNFLAPQRYSKEQLKTLDNVFDNMARFIGTQLTSMLRISCTARIIALNEMKIRDYHSRIGDSSFIGIVELMSPENWEEPKIELMILEKPISFAIMDYLLGGDGSCYNIDREYTEIEMDILKSVINQFAPTTNNVWNNYAPDVTRRLQMIETNLRMIQSIPADETVVVLELDLEIKGLHGGLHMVFPSSTMDAFLGVFASKGAAVRRKLEDEEHILQKRKMLENIKDTTLNVTGILGTTEIQVSELMELQPGDIFLLNDARKDSSVSIEVEGETWFKGKIGVHKKNYAVKVTETVKMK